MIAIGIILALTAAFITALCVYWKNIVQWIKKAVHKLEEVLKITVKGTRTFIKKGVDGFKNVSKYYSENKITGAWEEHVYTKSVSVSEVPPEILEKVQTSSVDEEISTTEELQLTLAN